MIAVLSLEFGAVDFLQQLYQILILQVRRFLGREARHLRTK